MKGKDCLRFIFIHKIAPFLLVPAILCGASFSTKQSVRSISQSGYQFGRKFSAEGTPSNSNTIYEIGDLIQDGDLAIIVLGWKYSTENPRGFAADDGNKFLLVDIMFINNSNQKKKLFFSVTLRKTSGQEYTCTGCDSFFNLQPNERERGWVWIEVPQTDTGDNLLTLQSSETFITDTISINLGGKPSSQEPPENLLLPDPNVIPMGQPVERGDLLFTVLGWSISQGEEWARPEPGLQLIAVDFIIKNNGAEPLEVGRAGMEIELRDSHYSRYDRDHRFSLCLDPVSNWITANPGEIIRCPIMFQLPLSSEKFVLIYHPSDESFPEAYIQLSDQPQTLPLPVEFSVNGTPSHRPGEVIQSGGIAVAVLGWKESGGDSVNRPDYGKKYILVDVMIANLGGTVFSSKVRSTMTLIDSGQERFPITMYEFPSGFEYLNFPSMDLAPGEKERGYVVFQIPESGKDFSFSLDIGGSTVLVALGSDPVSLDPPTELLSPNPNAYDIGEVIRYGNVSFEVIGWNFGSGINVQPEAGHVFLVVKMRIQNTGAPIEIFPIVPEVRDASGYIYRNDYHITVRNEQFEYMNAYRKNELVTGSLVYQVRDSAGEYALLVNASWLGKDVFDPPIIINLGSQPIEVNAFSDILESRNLPPIIFPILGILVFVFLVAIIGVTIRIFRRKRKNLV